MPRVLCVTGAYAPEFSAGGLQVRAVSAILAARARFEVVTTSTDRRVPRHGSVDGIPVARVPIDPNSRWSRVTASARLFEMLGRAIPRADVVHVQGYSSKNIPVAAIATLARRPLILHLQTARHDEPPAIRAQGRAAWKSFSSADRYIAVSPALKDAAIAGGIAPERIAIIPNGVDTNRFRPASADEKRRLREELSLPAEGPIVLFVGVISPDKQPHVLLDAWVSLQAEAATRSTIVFVGATNPALFELADNLAGTLRATLARHHLQERAVFVEPTPAVEKYFRAADLLVMPTVREGCPNVLLEAMACGLPAVSSRLPGATDAIIEDGVNGVLVDVGDRPGFAGAMATLLRDPAAAGRMGAEARRTIDDRFRIEHVAERWLAVYEGLIRP